jgi:hypothetical protein
MAVGLLRQWQVEVLHALAPGLPLCYALLARLNAMTLAQGCQPLNKNIPADSLILW